VNKLRARFSAWRKRRRERNAEEGVQRDILLLTDYRCFPERSKGLLGVHEPDDLPNDL
jgi:hypothetical protein